VVPLEVITVVAMGMILTKAIHTVKTESSRVTVNLQPCRTPEFTPNHPMPNDALPLCQCPFLRHLAADPDVPIQYDPRLNEYHIVGTLSLTMIYHCPFCGGRAPKSLRPFQFHYLPETERQRLENLMTGLDSLESIVSKLGAPTIDLDPGKPSEEESADGDPTAPDPFYRELRYEALSDAADLRVGVRRSGAVQCTITEKPHRQAATSTDAACQRALPTAQTPSASAGAPR
jgi:hypothetical protein